MNDAELLEFDDKSILPQVMWCCRPIASCHYLSQYWSKFMSPYCVTRPKWVKAEQHDQNKNAYLKSVYLVNDIYISWLWFKNIQKWSNMLCNWHLISPDSYLQLVYRNTIPNGHGINNSCRCGTWISYQTVPTKRQGPLLLTWFNSNPSMDK